MNMNAMSELSARWVRVFVSACVDFDSVNTAAATSLRPLFNTVDVC